MVSIAFAVRPHVRPPTRAVEALDFASTTLIFAESVIAAVPVSAVTAVLVVVGVVVLEVVLSSSSSLAQPRKTKLIITIIGSK